MIVVEKATRKQPKFVDMFLWLDLFLFCQMPREYVAVLLFADLI